MSNVVIGGFKTTKTREFQVARWKVPVASLHPASQTRDIAPGRGERAGIAITLPLAARLAPKAAAAARSAALKPVRGLNRLLLLFLVDAEEEILQLWIL